MNHRREQQVHRLFLQALEQPPRERRRFLDRVCSQNPELLRIVSERLKGMAVVEGNLREVGFMNPGTAATGTVPAKEDFRGDHIGPYRLVGKLGEGGMGSVYLADRDDGEFRMRVAIKIIRRDLTSESLVRRFRRERQIMANLQHPYIASLHDGGTTPEGHPYFVMEYVDGHSIDRFCRDQGLNLDQRLKLYRKVCEGVSFAHGKGIVHRDIKPGNILVTKWGEPKLLDFGIASIETDSSRTATGEMLLSPAYASPEQIKNQEVGISSDIYSLGVLLFELLTGRLPYELDGLSNHQIGYIICEETPPRPSSLIAGNRDAGTGKSQPKDLARAQLANLDDIVLKALNKEPQNRYGSIAQLLENIRFYQDGLRMIDPEDKAYDIFLCYRSDRQKLADRIAELLGARLEIDPKRGAITGSEPAKKALELGLDNARFCVLLVGPDPHPPWQYGPLRAALAVRIAMGTVRVLPLLLPGTRRPAMETLLPPFLRRLVWPTLEGFEEDPAVLNRIVSMVAHHRSGPREPMIEKEACPFRGLEAFHEEHHRLFFGRDSLIQRLVQHLQEHRFLAVLGPSGSGKSSVVRAGLMPELRARGNRLALFTPSPRPLTELAFALAGLIGEKESSHFTDQMLRRLRRDQDALHSLLLERGLSRVLLVIDQFEELFTLAQDLAERESFLGNLLFAVDQPDGPLSVVLTMRSDFLGQCTEWPDLNSFVSEHLIQAGPMSREELRRAVEGPARLVGLAFEEGLVSRILEGVSGAPGELPLLQHALLELYEHRDGGLLTAAAYTKIGGIEGALTRRADAEFANLDRHEREVLREMFVLCLVQTVEGSEDTRRSATREELSAVDRDMETVERLLQRWTAARLLTVRLDEALGIDLVEVAHEALIRRWDKIRTWMAEDRTTTRLIHRLRQEARAWNDAGQPPELLPRGSRLMQLSELDKERIGHLGPLEKAFLAAACEARDREEREREERGKKELQDARALAFRARIIAVITFAGLVMFGLLAWQLGDKEKETQRLLAESYLRESRSAWNERNLSMAVHLSAEALKSLPAGDPNEPLLFHYHYLMEYAPWSLFALHHDNYVAGAILDHRQTRILSWSFDKTLRLWDAVNGQALGQPMRHEDKVWGAVFSSDDRRILSWSFDHTLRVWDAATGKQLGSPMRHEDKVWGAVFGRDDGKILSWGFDHTVRLWDTATCRPLGQPMRHEKTVIGATFSKDESKVLSWGKDGAVQLWDLASGRPLGPAMRHDDWVWGAAFSANETRILSWGKDRSLRQWNAATAEPLGPVMAHGAWVRGAELSRGSDRIYSWSDDHTVRSWDTETGLPTGPPLPHGGKVVGASLDRDGARLLTWSEDHSVRLWEADSGRQLIPPMLHGAKVLGALFSPDEKRILSWSIDKSLRLWDAETGQQTGPALSHGDVIMGALFFRDGDRILTWGYDKTIRLWAITDPQSAPSLFHEGPVMDVVLSRDGERALSCGDDGAVRLWSLENGTQLGTPMIHEDKVWGAVFDRDERRILSWGRDRTLRLWDAKTRRQILPSMVHDDWVRGSVFSKEDRYILSWSNDRTVRLWDTATHRQIGPSMAHDDGVRGARFNSSEQRVLSWSNDKTIRFWNVATGEPTGPTLRHDDRVVGAAFDRSERRVLSWGEDRTIRLWDADTGAPLGPILAHNDIVWGATFFQNEERILSWSYDKTIRVWDVATGKQRGPSLFHDDVVLGAMLTNDETRILSWGRDKTVRIWDLNMGRQLGPALRHGDAVIGALLSSDDDLLLAWAGKEIKVRRLGADLDLEADLANLQVRVTTRMDFDPLTRVLTPIEEESLASLRQTYLERAMAHYLECGFRDYNLFGQKYLEQRGLAQPQATE